MNAKANTNTNTNTIANTNTNRNTDTMGIRMDTIKELIEYTYEQHTIRKSILYE